VGEATMSRADCNRKLGITRVPDAAQDRFALMLGLASVAGVTSRRDADKTQSHKFVYSFANRRLPAGEGVNILRQS
jgi:hypothetical protein